MGIGCQGTGVGAPASDAPAASWAGGSISQAELQADVAEELSQLETRTALQRYEILHRALGSRVEAEVLAARQEATGAASIEALLQAEVDAKVPEAEESRIRREFDRLAAQMPGADYATVRPHLVRQLRESDTASARLDYIAALKDDAGLRLHLPYPDIPRTHVEVREHDAVRGPADAAVTLVMFGEYQCFFCRKALPLLERLAAAHGDVRVVFKDFPMQGHDAARDAAVAARCAGQQGRYWEMADRLMERQDQLAPSDLEQHAVALGLDVAPWRDCVADGIWQERIEESVRDGRAAGVHATPTFFVNGRMVAGSVGWERLDDLVSTELAAVARAR
jgi:protein-disulfide isomerase